jgi:hypothetical protein
LTNLDKFIREPAGLGRRGYDGPSQPWMNVLSAVLWTPFVAIVAFAVFEAFISFAETERSTPSWWGILAIAMVILSLGIVAYAVRERVRTRLYPLAEIGVGIAAASAAVHAPSNADGLARLIAILAAIRIIVDGISRYALFHRERAAKG